LNRKKNDDNGKAAADEAAQTPSDRGEIAVLVTTGAHRGVFFGWASNDSNFRSGALRLLRARNCIAWSRSVGGVFGLAATGPNAECRIGAQVPALRLADVNSVTEGTAEAAAAWGAAPCVS